MGCSYFGQQTNKEVSSATILSCYDFLSYGLLLVHDILSTIMLLSSITESQFTHSTYTVINLILLGMQCKYKYIVWHCVFITYYDQQISEHACTSKFCCSASLIDWCISGYSYPSLPLPPGGDRLVLLPRPHGIDSTALHTDIHSTACEYITIMYVDIL